MRFRQEEDDEADDRQGDGGEGPHHPVDLEDLEDLRVDLDDDEDEEVGERRDDASHDAADGRGEELAGHDPGQLQHAEHAGGDVGDDAELRHPRVGPGVHVEGAVEELVRAGESHEESHAGSRHARHRASVVHLDAGGADDAHDESDGSHDDGQHELIHRASRLLEEVDGVVQHDVYPGALLEQEESDQYDERLPD